MKKGFIAVLSTIIGAMAGGVGVFCLKEKQIQLKNKKVDKFKDYYHLLNQWLIHKQEGKCLEQYFIDNNYKSIAIYGMGEVGNRLYNELKDSKINVLYAIDESSWSAYSDIRIINIDDYKEVDVIVVSAIFDFDNIIKEISEKVNCPIISLEDVVYDL